MTIKDLYTGKDPESVATMITNRILALAKHSRHPLRVALSGGSTPDSLFRYWLKRPKGELAGLGIHFWWVDERLVPPESKDSNYGNAFRAFFGPANYPLDLLHPIAFDEKSTPEEMAASYDLLLQKDLEKEPRPSAFDLVILGVGDDGHTSSLFPGQPLFDEEAYYIPSINPYNGIRRVALSYRGILRSPHIIFHVLGESKKEILKSVTSPSDESEKRLPAAYVIGHAQEVSVFTDQEL